MDTYQVSNEALSLTVEESFAKILCTSVTVKTVLQRTQITVTVT